MLMQNLLADVTGVGPGKSLADKLTLAQAYFAVPDIEATCGVLDAFTNQVSAQDGKKLSAEQAAEFTLHAEGIISAIGCD